MKTERISYSKKEGGEESHGEVTYGMPETIEEAVQHFGEDVVLSKACASITIDIQRICRSADSPEAAQIAVDKFLPGVARARTISGVSKKALMELLKGLSKEKLQELMESAKTG